MLNKIADAVKVTTMDMHTFHINICLVDSFHINMNANSMPIKRHVMHIT